MAKRIVLDVSTGTQREEEFEFIPSPSTPTAVSPEMVRNRVVELIRAATSVDDLKRALLLQLGELRLRPDGSLELE